mmetsp:Transcript_8635/g.24233  ORF Transcript_8635/g.24233 Transcript_8635/m.24233 type:complete len:434 (-) Transcript_8635:977-2278(-)
MNGSDETERQPSMLPRLPSPCELPRGALSQHSPSCRARVLSLNANMSKQSSPRSNSLSSQLFSPSFDIDVNADLIKPSSSNDTTDINVEIQRILAEAGDKSTSSHVESSAGSTSTCSLGCQKDEPSATADALGGTDSSKISPVQYQQALSSQEDHGSLARIAAAAAAAISATAGLSPGTVAATEDEHRQKSGFRGAASLLGQGGDRDESAARRKPSQTAHQYQHYAPQPTYHEHSGYPEYNGPLYRHYLFAEWPIAQLSVPQSSGLQPSMVPPRAACAASSCIDLSPPVQETKRWRRRRPKQKKKASPKKHKSPFDHRPAKGPGSRGKRGGYKCRLCGEAKARHVCSALEPHDASAQEDAEIQTEAAFADEKIALGSGIGVIVVRERRVDATVLLLDGKVGLDKSPEEGSGEVGLGAGGGHDDDEEVIPFAAV